jgi:hypothetical protein
MSISPFDDSILSTVADVYSPSRNDDGELEDCLRGYHFKSGLRCGCGTKTLFAKRANFMSHIQSKSHKDWIHNLNRNTANYFNECVELRELVNNQKLIIARLDADNSGLRSKLAAKDAVIMCLAEKISTHAVPSEFLELN